ncbi:hypothetical protein [Marmoricola endophyticus]|uniref:hypothetical protein n=1 Tax=Marmoricola endophyticus TaxID=2040280 RepID=UPI001662ADAB|nr:hypothetical protein [Marmoricola endophyticus]
MSTPRDHALPVSALLAGWLGACLSGGAHPEEMLDALGTDEVLHRVTGLAPDPLTLVMTVAELRARGARWVGLALPVPGDPVGLAGPADVNAAALDAGQAVLVRTGDVAVALVPEEAEEAVTWLARPAATPRPLDPGEAGQALRLDLHRTTAQLVDLDVARWSPEVADALMALRDGTALPLPPSYDARRRAAVERAVTCLAIVDLARESESAAVSAAEIERRRSALDPLERSARHALVAACSG